MKTTSYVVQDPLGIHARPAGMLVQTARKFQAALEMQVGDKKADLKRIFAIMVLDVKKGTEVTITAAGEDEQEAIQAITDCLQKNF